MIVDTRNTPSFFGVRFLEEDCKGLNKEGEKERERKKKNKRERRG